MKRWRRLAALLAAGVIMAISLCGCNVVLLLNNLDGTASPKTFTSDDGRFSLTATDAWERDTSPENQMVDLMIDRLVNWEGYVAVFSENKTDYTDMTLEAYAEGLSKDLGDSWEDTVIERTDFAGYPAYTFVLQGTINQIRVTYRAYCLETGDSYVRLLGWMRASDWEEHESELQQVMDTLTIEE